MDCTITNNGSGFFILSACSSKGKRWLKANVPSQSHGVAYCDDTRMAWDIYQGMLADGLAVSA